MCKAPLPPTSPPTLATAFANIAQHWLDKYKKSNKKTKKHLRSFPQLPSNSSSPVPKGSQKATKRLPKSIRKASTNHSKCIQKASQNPPGPHPRKGNQKNILILCFMVPLVTKMDPRSHPEITKNSINSIIFSVGFPKNFDTLCCHLFSSSGVPRSSEMSLKHSACDAFRATPKIGKFSKFF